jgi:hypothetical protein
MIPTLTARAAGIVQPRRCRTSGLRAVRGALSVAVVGEVVIVAG